MPRFSDRGIPILSLHEKLVALASCMARDHHEDAAGHLCDLLELCRQNIHPSVGGMFNDLNEMVNYYGKYPAPIDDLPE